MNPLIELLLLELLRKKRDGGSREVVPHPPIDPNTPFSDRGGLGRQSSGGPFAGGTISGGGVIQGAEAGDGGAPGPGLPTSVEELLRLLLLQQRSSPQTLSNTLNLRGQLSQGLGMMGSMNPAPNPRGGISPTN